MARFNLSKLAEEVCKREGLKKQVDIAQVKEVLNCLFDYLYMSEDSADILNSLMASAEKRLAKKNNAGVKVKLRKIAAK